MRDNISTIGATLNEVAGRIINERDDASLQMKLERGKGDIVMEMKQRGRRDGLQRAFDLLVEAEVIVP
ncbi:MAG TPA: hypothetical protein VLO13_02915 [Halomonas sp.]|nr:hypothetical protein [Halomonas sp.]